MVHECNRTRYFAGYLVLFFYVSFKPLLAAPAHFSFSVISSSGRFLWEGVSHYKAPPLKNQFRALLLLSWRTYIARQEEYQTVRTASPLNIFHILLCMCRDFWELRETLTPIRKWQMARRISTETLPKLWERVEYTQNFQYDGFLSYEFRDVPQSLANLLASPYTNWVVCTFSWDRPVEWASESFF